MKITLTGRDIPRVFHELTNVEIVWSARYSTAIGDTTTSLREVEIHAEYNLPYICRYDGRDPEKCGAVIYEVIKDRFFFLSGQEISKEDITRCLEGTSYMVFNVIPVGSDMQIVPGTFPSSFPTWKERYRQYEWQLLAEYMPGGARSSWGDALWRQSAIDEICDQLMEERSNNEDNSSH
jgi:hypothetical protein